VTEATLPEPGLKLDSLKGIGEADGEDGEEGRIAEVVVVAIDEGSQVLLEGCVLIDRLATNGGWLGGVAGAAAEGDLEAGLANIVEAHLEGNAEVAFGAGDHVSEAEGKAGGDLAEVDASASM